MKGKILTIIISAAMMLTLCSSCKDRSNAETGETEITTASETTAPNPSSGWYYRMKTTGCSS